MSAFPKRKTKKPIDPLNKKIPENPKYKDVQAVVDTGSSLSKYMRKVEEIRQNYRYRKDEVFKRMKPTTFVQLMIQVAEINALDNEVDENFPPAKPKPQQEKDGTGDALRPDTADTTLPDMTDNGHDMTENGKEDDHSPALSLAVTEGDYGATPSNMNTARSTLQSVMRGVGELDLNRPNTPKILIDETRPYLLLDLRDRDEFDECHLITALSYPHAMLSRSVNFETKDMLAYKNQPGKIILVYDEDEKIAPKAASTLVERGYDNLFMLSGGLKVAYKLFPNGLITGTVPVTISPLKKGAARERASQTEYSFEDLETLNSQLDTALDDRSTGSRLSKASTAASRTTTQMTSRSVASSMSGSVTGRAPFK